MSDFQKQTVQWFPGHMAKTRRQIKESLPLVDAVTELLDARVPLSSRNPELNELIASKPHIVLLNKCDMADEAATRRWKAWFGRQGSPALAVDCRSGRGLNDYGDTVRELLRDKIQSNLEKGMAGRALRMMVVGIPNTGKSSFINRMAGRSRAKVADRPGVTRQNQWFAIGGGIELLDTPGVLWPKFDDPEVGNRLAFIGSVKDEVMDVENKPKIGCVVMAAGNARRFGENKLAAQLRGRSLILRALEAVPAEKFDKVVVVTQYPEVMRLAGEFHFAAIHNPHPDYGISHTIELGLTALRDCDGVLFQVSDQPLLRRESVAELVDRWRTRPEKIVALGHGGVRGNPCLFPARFFPELLELREDHGGNTVIRRHEADLLLLDVPAEELRDVDTAQALEELKAEEQV